MRSSGPPSSTSSTARNPDLAKLPMYCVVFSFKNWYDAKDMRGTGGNDVDFAMDVPKYDSPDVADLRRQGRHHLCDRDRRQRRLGRVGPGPDKPKTLSCRSAI